MMSLFVLLIAFFSFGNSRNNYDEVEYGDKHRKLVPVWVHYIEFIPKSGSEATVLWNRSKPDANGNSRMKVSHDHFYIYNMTQRDSGQYLWRNRDRTFLSTVTIEVIAKTRSFTLRSDEELFITTDLEPNSCNIYFIPEDGRETAVVRRGRLLQSADQSGCFGLKLLKPCGILKEAVQTLCSGQFVVRDNNDDQALVATVEVEEPSDNTTYMIAGVMCVFLVLSCCFKTACIRKSTKQHAQPEDADSEPAPYAENERKPDVLRPSQPSETFYPVQPSEATTVLLINNPTESIPPSYHEEWRTNYSTVPVLAAQLDPPTVPLGSQQDQDRFEVKGIDTNNLLSSDYPHYDVYTSDKLNFL